MESDSYRLFIVLYREAILMVYNNTDINKVYHWLVSTMAQYNNKPKPITQKEIDNRLLKKQRKVDRNVKKQNLLMNLKVLYQNMVSL